MEKYSRLLSAAVVIGAFGVKQVATVLKILELTLNYSLLESIYRFIQKIGKSELAKLGFQKGLV